MALDTYGEWWVGLGIEVVDAEGARHSWNEAHNAVGTEEGARRAVLSKMRATIRQDYPNARGFEVIVLQSDLVIDHFPAVR